MVAVPKRFTGKFLLLMATAGPSEGGQMERWSSWEPYIAGTIERHSVDCLHEDMMKPQARREIGRLISAELDCLDRTSSGYSPRVPTTQKEIGDD